MLISFDIEEIKKEGYKVTTTLLIANTDDYVQIVPAAKGKITADTEEKIIGLIDSITEELILPKRERLVV